MPIMALIPGGGSVITNNVDRTTSLRGWRCVGRMIFDLFGYRKGNGLKRRRRYLRPNPA